MRLLKRKKQHNLKPFQRGVDRAKNLSKGELVDWIDTAGTELAKHMSSYRRTPDGFIADVARENALILAGLCDELARRHHAAKL